MCTPVKFEKIISKKVLLFLFLITFTACGVANQQRAPSQNSRPDLQSDNIVSALQQAHNDWQGTPYVLGGSGIGGVDCSSFMQILFDDYFGISLPRNTRQQLQKGSSVRRKFISAGDLIFFRTGRDLLHVGVALDGNRFLHASVSSGVMISNLNQRYWASRYLATRRVM